MKLYTEDQLKYVFKTSRAIDDHTNNFVYGSFDEIKFDGELVPIKLPSNSICINCDESKSTHNVCMDCIIRIGKENIELPSDEEIEKEVNCTNLGLVYDFNLNVGFKKGAKWMRDKLQGGNK